MNCCDWHPKTSAISIDCISIDCNKKQPLSEKDMKAIQMNGQLGLVCLMLAESAE